MFQLQKFRDELKNRSRVLKKLGHIDADSVVQVKGRAACLIDTGDELLVTELMFNGELIGICSLFFCIVCSWLRNLIIFVLFILQSPLGTFNDLDHHQVAALASCFIPVDKSTEQIQLRSELARPLQQLQDSARRIAEVYYHLT
jgi:ATP-dependent RNA helicase DOB1